MKKILVLSLFMSFVAYKSQYLIVGKDSISVSKFKTENQYGLENAGIENTIKTYVDFKLLQQFALDKKADTLSYFKKSIEETEQRLREANFYPKEIMQSALNQYFSSNLVEKKIQVFYIEKSDTDKTDYNKIYSDVKSGKISIENAISQYTKQKPEAFFVKSGNVDVELDKELQVLQIGNFTKLINNSTIVAFAKLVDRRPSLGYIIFGAISYPKTDSDKMKSQIFDALKSGKKFEEVAKLYGSTDSEKNNAGVVMGSPILPDAVYEAFKNKKEGEYTEPILIGEKYYVFNLYSVIPYQSSEKHNPMFIKDMMDSPFADVAYNKLVESLVKSKDYKEFPDFAKIKKSYADFLAFKNDKAILYQFNKDSFSFGELKKILTENFKNADKLPKEQWATFLDSKRGNDVFGVYSRDFLKKPDVKEELAKTQQNLLADYLFSYWMEEEIKNKPEILENYYQKNKQKYIWEKRADARVAILRDFSLEKDITKEINDAKNWDALNKKYYGKLNDKQELVVHFEKGEMSESADVFTVNKVPFEKGIHKVKLGERFLIIAIDAILPNSQMTKDEAMEQLKSDVTEDILTKTITEQRNKTKITIEPSFKAELEKNFKK